MKSLLRSGRPAPAGLVLYSLAGLATAAAILVSAPVAGAALPEGSHLATACRVASATTLRCVAENDGTELGTATHYVAWARWMGAPDQCATSWRYSPVWSMCDLQEITLGVPYTLNIPSAAEGRWSPSDPYWESIVAPVADALDPSYDGSGPAPDGSGQADLASANFYDECGDDGTVTDFGCPGPWATIGFAVPASDPTAIMGMADHTPLEAELSGLSPTTPQSGGGGARLAMPQ